MKIFFCAGKEAFQVVFISIVLLLEIVSVNAQSATTPIVKTNPFYTKGAIAAFCRGEAARQGNKAIKEAGICWSTNPEPTVNDNKIKAGVVYSSFLIHIRNLSPNTVYYVRAYAINTLSEVGYGDVITVKTLPKGNVTYSLYRGEPADPAVYERIDKAMKEAVEWYNNYTTVTKHIRVNYHPGIPTAQANYDGSMGFGAKENYQYLGTALHEMGHTVGVGTCSMWNRLCVNRKWIGSHANEILRFMTGNPDLIVEGDNTHFWPYGINGYWEDDGQEMTRIMHVLLIQGMSEDGLPPTTALPASAAVFECDSLQKFYIKSEDIDRKRSSGFLTEDASGKLVITTMTAKSVLSDDNAAWNVILNKTLNRYMIRNVATGHYFKFVGNLSNIDNARGENHISMEEMNAAEKSRYLFQLVRSINIEIDKNQLFRTPNSYAVIVRGSAGNQCLDAYSATTTGTWDFWMLSDASHPLQYWMFLSDKEVRRTFEPVSDIIAPEKDDLDILVYSSNGNIIIKSELPQEASVYSIDGRWIKNSNETIIPIHPGLYIVKIGNNSFKVLVGK